MPKEDREIRIIKKKAAGHGHHGGAWKVAYADFVTAMMAFFLVMWLVGLDIETRRAIAGYFRDPTGFFESYPRTKNIVNINDAQPPGGKNTTEDPHLSGDKGMRPPGKKPGDKDRATEKAEMETFKKYLEAALANIPELARIKKHVKIEFVKEGLRIELMEGPEPVFFKLGSAEVTPGARHLLAVIAKALRKLDNRIIVEGHTDARPYKYGNGYTNWELSTDRANAARRVLEASGLWKGQVAEVRGYADTRLRIPQNPYHYANRRVTLLIPYQSEAEPQ